MVHARKGQPHRKLNSRQLQRRLCLSAKRRRFFGSVRMGSDGKDLLDQGLECLKKKVVGKPYKGELHVRFEVAGNGDVLMSVGLRPIAKVVEEPPSSKGGAPFPDPTTTPHARLGLRQRLRRSAT